MEVVILIFVAALICLQLYSIYLIFRDSKRNDDMLNEILDGVPKTTENELNRKEQYDEWGDKPSEW